MQISPKGEFGRTSMLCIDSYEAGVPKGRLHLPAKDTIQPFESLSQLLLMMEENFEASKFPQAFSAMRTFTGPQRPRPGAPPEEKASQGALATFAVRILFRQNSSWQGSISWLEGNNEESFRSVLEMVFLMDSALRLSEGSA